MTAQMKAYLDRWCAFFDAEWRWHKQYYPKMKGKKIGLITVCGDPNVSPPTPSFTASRTPLNSPNSNGSGPSGLRRGQRGDRERRKGEEEAYELGKKAAEDLNFPDAD